MNVSLLDLLRQQGGGRRTGVTPPLFIPSAQNVTPTGGAGGGGGGIDPLTLMIALKRAQQAQGGGQGGRAGRAPARSPGVQRPSTGI